MKGYQQQVSTLEEVDLKRYQDSVLGRLEEKPKNLAEKNSRFMEALGMGYESFDFRAQLAAAIRSITVAELQQAYTEMLLEQPRSLWLKTADSAEPSTLIDIREESSDYAYDF